MSKIKKAKPRAKRLNWEQEFVAKYGLPEIVNVSALQLADLRWGKAECYSLQEGAKA